MPTIRRMSLSFAITLLLVSASHAHAQETTAVQSLQNLQPKMAE